MSKLEKSLALIRSYTRSLVVVALLAVLAYAALLSPPEIISPDAKGQILGGITAALGTAIVFYFKKDEEHKEVTQDENAEE
jgi:hypothetical protein